MKTAIYAETVEHGRIACRDLDLDPNRTSIITPRNGRMAGRGHHFDRLIIVDHPPVSEEVRATLIPALLPNGVSNIFRWARSSL